MLDRKILLRVLFWSLGLGAVLGAAAVLFAHYEAMWRIVATTFLTSVASGLLLGCSLLPEKEKTRWAGLFYIAWVIIQFMLSLTLIWLVDRIGGRAEERLALTILFNSLIGIPAGLMLIMARTKLGRAAGWTQLCFLGAVWLLTMGAIWVDDYRFENRLSDHAAATAAFSPIFFFSLLGLGDRRHWRWLGVAAGAAGLFIVCYAIHYRIYSDSPILTWIASFGVVVAHVNAMMLIPLKPNQNWVRWITLASGAMAAALIDIAAAVHPDHLEWIFRGTASSVILASCGTIALLVLAFINRKVERPVVPITSVDRITLVCPICHSKHALPAGDSRCPTCNVIFHIRLEEPHCPNCDYSLLMLESDRCPECGTFVGHGELAQPNQV